MDDAAPGVLAQFRARAFGRKSWLAGLLFVAIVTALLCLPFIRAVGWYGDEGILLRGAAEMASGQKIYSDFFAFYPPAGYLIVEAWINIFGHSFIAARILALAATVGISCFAYLACVEVSANLVLSAFLVLAWAATIPPSWIVVISHHWLTTLPSMAACWLALCGLGTRRSSARAGLPLLAGMLGGAAAMVLSSTGTWVTLATAASFIDLRRFRRQFVACLLGCLIVPLLCLAYIVLIGALVPAFDDIVRFTLTQYAGIQRVPYGAAAPEFSPDVYLFPVAGVLALITLATDFRTVLRDPCFRACGFFALAGLAGAYPRPDLPHLAFTAPLALPLAAYTVSRLTLRWLPIYRRAALGLAMLSCMHFVTGLVRHGLIVLRAPVTATAAGPISPIGGARIGSPELFRFIASTSPEDKFLFYPYIPLIPFLAQRQQVTKYDLFVPDYTTPAQYFEACQAAAQQAKWVVLDQAQMAPEYWQHAFPAMKDPHPPETRAFEQAIQQNFAFVSRMGNFEVWQRTPTTSNADCSKISLHGKESPYAPTK